MWLYNNINIILSRNFLFKEGIVCFCSNVVSLMLVFRLEAKFWGMCSTYQMLVSASPYLVAIAATPTLD